MFNQLNENSTSEKRHQRRRHDITCFLFSKFDTKRRCRECEVFKFN